MERGSVPNVLFIGLLAAAFLLVGFKLAPDPIRSYLAPGSQHASPTTLQVEALQAEEALSNPVEGGVSQLIPSATVGETAAMLASETLLLNLDIFSLELPIIMR